MFTKDARVDAYILNAADFAKPVLEHLRNLILEANAGIEETMKWNFPNYTYKGSIVCSMAAFKNHCSFGFWLASQMKDPEGILHAENKTAMGNLGQIKSIQDLPADKIIVDYIKQAVQLTGAGVKILKKEKPKQTVEPHEDFIFALNKDETAHGHYTRFSPSQQKEYNEWINGAKTESTRQKRIADAVLWLHSGKTRNWKYEKC